jgi:Abortive infection C-terminus
LVHVNTNPRKTGDLMATAPLSDPIVAAVADLFHADRWQPSHDDLTIQFGRAGLSHGDPRNTYAMTGKRKRVRGVLLYALDHDEAAGKKLVANLVGLVKGAGGFRSSSEFYVGDETFSNAREAFKAEGFELDLDGNLRPRLLENLDGEDLTGALFAYVRRARQGSADAALVTGTGKDLLEATARHVLVGKGRSYAGLDFPGTLYQAFLAVGLTPSPGSVKAMSSLSSDAREKLVDALYVAGCSVNTLRNKEGTGHGRPFLTAVTEDESRAAVEVMGTISEFLLREASH